MNTDLEKLFLETPEDFRFNIFQGGIGCDVVMKITHTPTGNTGKAKGRNYRIAREKAMENLGKEIFK